MIKAPVQVSVLLMIKAHKNGISGGWSPAEEENTKLKKGYAVFPCGTVGVLR